MLSREREPPFKFQGQPSRQTGLNIAKPNYRGEDDIFHLKVIKYPHKALKWNNHNNGDVSTDETCPAFSKHTGYTPYD